MLKIKLGKTLGKLQKRKRKLAKLELIRKRDNADGKTFAKFDVEKNH